MTTSGPSPDRERSQLRCSLLRNKAYEGFGVIIDTQVTRQHHSNLTAYFGTQSLFLGSLALRRFLSEASYQSPVAGWAAICGSVTAYFEKRLLSHKGPGLHHRHLHLSPGSSRTPRLPPLWAGPPIQTDAEVGTCICKERSPLINRF
jgi:hypothetical protein